MKRKNEVAGPVAPFARVTGRLVLPDGRGGAGGSLTLDPLPCNVRAVTADGPAVVAASVRITLDNDGRVASDAGPFVDVIGCGEGVKPAGDWAYLVRLAGPGVAWTGVAVLQAGKTYDLTDILAGVLAGSDGGGAVDDAALKALAEKLDELHDAINGEYWQGLELDLRDDGEHVQFGGLKSFREAFDGSMRAIQAALDDVARLPERVKDIEEGYVTNERFVSLLNDGGYGVFPVVIRPTGNQSRVAHNAPIKEAFLSLARAVVAADKDLAAVKDGPYKVSGLSANGGRIEAVDRDLAGVMTHISKTIEDMGGVIRNVSTEVTTAMLYGSEKTGGLGALSELSEGFQTLDTRLKAVESAGGVPGPAGPQGEPGPAGPQGPQGEPGAGVREQTAWTKLADLPANLVTAGNGNGVYVRRHGSVVYMAIRGANPAAGLVKFTVPAGYRHSFSMAAMGVMIPCDDPKLAGKLQFGHQGAFEWKGASGVTDLGYGVLSYPTNDPWPES